MESASLVRVTVTDRSLDRRRRRELEEEEDELEELGG